MNRSSCASGKAYVPSYSIGFDVATTWNGSGNGNSALDGDLPLRHRLQQRRLGLRRGPVDLVREEEAGEHRAGPETNSCVAGA